MSKSRRNATTAALAAVALLSRTLGVAAEPWSLVLHITDHAHISSADLEGAEAEATRIYRAADINIRWVNPGTATPDMVTDAVEFNVVLLDWKAAEHKIIVERIDDDVLGQAARAIGHAYIFCDRIAFAAAARAQDFRVAFGRVLAHETGHLLLTANGHSETGIMRPGVEWSKIPQHFNSDQIVAMHATITAAIAAKHPLGRSGTAAAADAERRSIGMILYEQAGVAQDVLRRATTDVGRIVDEAAVKPPVARPVESRSRASVLHREFTDVFVWANSKTGEPTEPK